MQLLSPDPGDTVQNIVKFESYAQKPENTEWKKDKFKQSAQNTCGLICNNRDKIQRVFTKAVFADIMIPVQKMLAENKKRKGEKMHNKVKLIAIIVCLALVLAGCGGSKEAAEAVDLNSYTLDEIIAKAKEEGHLESVGMPDTWANWGLTWDGYTEEYGITHNDSDMSSAEELAMFANDPTKAIGDVGFAFTTQAVEQDAVQSYKTSYWDSVPDWAKDPEGRWMVGYTGATTFIYNQDLCDEPMPTSWEDVRKGSYTISIGDVVGGATGQGVVVATAYAFGGDLDNLQPAYDFWLEMAKAGRINKLDILLQNIEAGEIELGVTWSYNALTYRDSAIESKGYDMKTCIPSDGSILVGYASVINKNTDTPFAAALAREYIFSDQGQINLAKAGAIPSRTDVSIPQDVIDATFDPSEYANAVGINDVAHYTEVCNEISEWWNENIIPLL